MSSGPPLDLGSPHHLSLVVSDLEAAMAEMEPVTGPWFVSPVREGGVPVRTEAGKAVVELRVAFTVAGPMHIELLQAVPGTVWEPRERAYLHHTGYWVPAERIAPLSKQLDALGMRREACRWDDSGEPVGWAYHSWQGGGRIELVEEGRPPGLAEAARG